MTYQSNPQSVGFRELTPQELEAVAGGQQYDHPGFTVYGSRDSFSFYGFSAGLGHDSGVGEVDRSGGDDTIFDCELVGAASGVILGAIALPGATIVTGGPVGGAILSGLLGVTFAETVETICERHQN